MGQHPDFVYYLARWRQARLRQEAATAKRLCTAKPGCPRQWARRFVAMLMLWRPGAALAVEP